MHVNKGKHYLVQIKIISVFEALPIRGILPQRVINVLFCQNTCFENPLHIQQSSTKQRSQYDTI